MTKTDAEIHELERRILVLEDENAFLAERAEESLLLGIVAESITTVEGKNVILETVLERISILTDLIYAGCFEVRDGKWLPLEAYVAGADRGQTPDHGELSLLPEICTELDSGPVVMTHGDEATLVIPGRAPDEVAGTLGLFPYDCISLGRGVFAFLDESGDSVRLRRRAPLLTRVVELTTDRLDREALTGELKAMNAELDDRVDIRTAELRESERRYRTLFDTITDAVFLWEVDENNTPGRCLECNLTAQRLLGRAREEILDLGPQDIWRPYSQQEVLDIRRLLAESQTAVFVSRVAVANGEHIPVSVAMHVLPYEGTLAVLALVRDVTQQQLVERRLRVLSSAVEQSSVGVVVLDKQGVAEYVNAAFCEAAGVAMDEALGASPQLLQREHSNGASLRLLWDTVRAGQPWSGELCGERPSGSRYWVQASVSPVRDAGGEITQFVLVSEDTTDTRQLQEQLHQSQRMEAVGRLAGGIAHDLNNQLGAICGSAELAMMEMEESHAAFRDLEGILEIVDRSAALNRKLLTFSQSHVADARTLDLNEVFAEAQRLLERVIGEDIRFTCIPAPNPLLVNCDPTQLEQVIVNLAVNARDAMPDGGSLTIRLGTEHVRDREGAVPTDVGPGIYAHLEVSDTGHGIEADVLPHIFEPFFTTKAEQGTGLGLSTVYGIVNRSRGFLHADSEPGNGTTFHVYLPISKRPATPKETRDDGTRVRRGTETILLVEDDSGVRTPTVRYLTRLGYSILEATTAAEALELWSRHPSEIDLLVSDVVMPGMRGPELIEHIRSEAPTLPVLLTSGHASGIAQSVDELGHGVEFLPKPLRLKDLAQRIRSILDNPPRDRDDVQPRSLI